MANSDQAIIEVRHLYKSFKMWDQMPAKELKAQLIRIFKRKNKIGSRHFAVLEDINFQIQPGEFVGIMGRNGVGKSTILKVISGIYTPDKGEVITRGGIAPLLELGAGFNPELSGYENIFLNAAILGYGRIRTREMVDQIIDFSELGEKISMPVKNYSSGMLVRLGFSIAAHLDSPIILLDEVLGVGDAGFVEKSTKKILSLHEEGRTVVLVTHNPLLVREHCSRCIFIDNKRVAFDGDPDTACDIYLDKTGSKNVALTTKGPPQPSI